MRKGSLLLRTALQYQQHPAHCGRRRSGTPVIARERERMGIPAQDSEVRLINSARNTWLYSRLLGDAAKAKRQTEDGTQEGQRAWAHTTSVLAPKCLGIWRFRELVVQKQSPWRIHPAWNSGYCPRYKKQSSK